MERRRLGDSDLAVSRLGLGAWAIGGPWAYGWGPQEDADSVATIERAVDLGINWIDTAAAYGLGRSERVVGRAVAAMPAASRPCLFTKCSLVWDERGTVSHSLAAASVRAECEASLRRLGVEAIDLYQVHWPAPPGGGDEGPLEEGWRALAALRREGKVRWIGVSNFDETQLARVAAVAPVTSLQPPYSMLRRGIEERILPWCQAHGTGVIVYSPMVSGLLTGTTSRERVAALAPDDWRRRHPEFQEPALGANLELVERLRIVGARHGRSVAEVAIAWTLRHPAVTAAIVGARRPGQVDGFVAAGEFTLDGEDLEVIEQALAARADRLGS